ncbi:hypothetical protein NGRA_3443, partial [Nosema granulosis]
MATATNSMREFHGKPEEDAAVWLRDVLLIARLGRFTEEDTLKAVVLKLRDTALAWASELIEQREWRINLEEFTLLFKKRFSNLYKTEVSLSKFLKAPSPSTREEFSALLNAGTILFEQKLMNSCALAQVLIGKCPDNIKGLLFQAIEQYNDWQSFIQRAEQVAWLAYPDLTLNRVTSSQQPTKNQTIKATSGRGKRYCELHGEGSHDSEHCRTLTLIKSKGWSKKIHSRLEAITEDEADKYEQDNIKQHFIYSTCSYFSSNPFFITGTISGTPRTCLLDTGADLSIMHEQMIPPGAETEKFSGSIFSACGSILPISKKLRSVEVMVLGKKIRFSPLITRKEPKYIIIGADVLIHHPEL